MALKKHGMDLSPIIIQTLKAVEMLEKQLNSDSQFSSSLIQQNASQETSLKNDSENK